MRIKDRSTNYGISVSNKFLFGALPNKYSMEWTASLIMISVMYVCMYDRVKTWNAR